ncbi:hypothetical protein ACFL4N_01475 [Thermodesulfobacteriota bacterium]
MSVENVNALFKKASEDDALHRELSFLAERLEAIYDDLIQIGSEADCEFTMADYNRARIEANRELSDEDLERVTGGGPGGASNCYTTLDPNCAASLTS